MSEECEESAGDSVTKQCVSAVGCVQHWSQNDVVRQPTSATHAELLEAIDALVCSLSSLAVKEIDWSSLDLCRVLGMLRYCAAYANDANRRLEYCRALADSGWATLYIAWWPVGFAKGLGPPASSYCRSMLAGMCCKRRAALSENVQRNFRIFAGIGWNCSDLSGTFCRGVVEHDGIDILLASLKSPTLLPSIGKHANKGEHTEPNRERCYNASDVHRTYIVDTCLAIILNALVFEQKQTDVLRSVPPGRTDSSCLVGVRRRGGLAVLSCYATAASMPMVRCKALLCMAHASTEQECHSGAAMGGVATLSYLVKLLDDAAGNDGHLGKWYPFSAKELLSGVNKLAQNDQNKREFVRLGALPIYTELLRHPLDNEELTLTLEGLWSFSFLADNRSEMYADVELIEALKSYQKHSDSGVVKPVKGTLFMLNYGNALGPDISATANNASTESLDEPHASQSIKPSRKAKGKKCSDSVLKQVRDRAPPAPALPKINKEKKKRLPGSVAPCAKPAVQPDGRPKHADYGTILQPQTGEHSIMISYQWQYKALVLQINELIKSSGIKTWIDVENMSGSVLEAMADAIEKATAVLVCYSESYKMSSSCRTEAEYTYKLQKLIVPVRVQSKYTADGWLGILLGNKLYFDMSTDERYRMNGENLVRQLLSTVAKDGDNVDMIHPHQVSILSEGPSLHETQTSSHASDKNGQASLDEVKVWDEGKVAQWLRDNNLQQLCDAFALFDGATLLALRDMQQRAPTEYYQSMKAQMKSQDSLPLLLKFTTALKELHA